jgi:exosortase
VSKAQWFWGHRPDLQFGWVVLFLCAYLFWEAAEHCPAWRFRLGSSCLLAFGLGCGILFLVQIYQAAFGSNAASVCGLGLGVMAVVAGNLIYVSGWRGVQHFGMAFAFILVALPMPSIVQGLIVGGLQSVLARINVELLNFVGVPAVQVGSLIQLPSCTVGIDEACSGVRSLQATLMATLFIGHLTLERWGLKVLLVALGVVLAVVGNLIRSLALSLIANARGPTGLESFHDAAGWSVLGFTVTGVILCSWLLGRMEKRLGVSP